MRFVPSFDPINVIVIETRNHFDSRIIHIYICIKLYILYMGKHLIKSLVLPYFGLCRVFHVRELFKKYNNYALAFISFVSGWSLMQQHGNIISASKLHKIS